MKNWSTVLRMMVWTFYFVTLDEPFVRRLMSCHPEPTSFHLDLLTSRKNLTNDHNGETALKTAMK